MNFNIEDYKGTHTALITPFGENGRFDRGRFKKQIEFQVKGGVKGIVPVGTTGESPTLTSEEHIRVIEMAVRFANGRVKVIAGTGANSTAEAVDLTRAAEKAGAEASLQVTPYYNKPTQEGLFRHFEAIARNTKLPIILYNVPSRCGVEISIETVERLNDECGNIIGIKEAGGSVDRVTEMRKRLGLEFLILSGDDSLTLPFVSAGANGVISVVSNVFPDEVRELTDYALREDFFTARGYHARLYPFTKTLFFEGNPAGVKYAMKLQRQDSGHLRLPLCEVSPRTRKAISDELVALRLWKAS